MLSSSVNTEGLHPVFLQVVDPVMLNKKHPQFSGSLRSLPQLGVCAARESKGDHRSTATEHPLKATRSVWQQPLLQATEF